jgi:hypothetical protein
MGRRIDHPRENSYPRLKHIPGLSHGFGLPGAVRIDGPRAPVLPSAMQGSVGEFYWAGYARTFFRVDPEEE